MHITLSSVVGVVIVSSTLAAQAPEQKPGPEHQRIAYFAGEWKYEGEAKQSPMGPGGKVAGTETCEWFAGGFQLVCRTKGTGPKGPGTGMGVMSYDPARKAYTYYAISSHGDNFFVRGQASGKVWTWNEESTVDGKVMKMRATVTEETPTSYSFKLEMSADGGPMTVIEEGKATKVKST